MNDIRDQKLQDNRPFLAYLSACSTGANEVLQLVDEAVHLVSVCQLAGFRHVVGTLWVVSDMYCVEVAQHLYRNIMKDGMTDAAVASGIHMAQRALREAQFDERKGADEVVSRGYGVTDQEGPVDRKGVPVVAGLRGGDFHWVPYSHFGV